MLKSIRIKILLKKSLPDLNLRPCLRCLCPVLPFYANDLPTSVGPKDWMKLKKKLFFKTFIDG